MNSLLKILGNHEVSGGGSVIERALLKVAINVTP